MLPMTIKNEWRSNCLVVLECALQKFNKCNVIYCTSRYSETMTMLLPLCLLLAHVTWKANAYNLSQRHDNIERMIIIIIGNRTNNETGNQQHFIALSNCTNSTPPKEVGTWRLNPFCQHGRYPMQAIINHAGQSRLSSCFFSSGTEENYARQSRLSSFFFSSGTEENHARQN